MSKRGLCRVRKVLWVAVVLSATSGCQALGPVAIEALRECGPRPTSAKCLALQRQLKGKAAQEAFRQLVAASVNRSNRIREGTAWEVTESRPVREARARGRSYSPSSVPVDARATRGATSTQTSTRTSTQTSTRTRRTAVSTAPVAASPPAPTCEAVRGMSRPAVCVSVGDSLRFADDSAKLPEGSKASLERFARELRGDANVFIYVMAYTEASGDARANLELSRQRARVVADYLVAQRIPADQIQAVGHGEDHLLDVSRPDALTNRRIEILVEG